MTQPDTRKIREAFSRVERTLALRPERGQRTYRNVTRLRFGTRCDVQEAGQHLVIDAAPVLGGDGAGPNPSMVLRSAFSSCIAIGIKQTGARRGIDIDAVDVTLETDVDARGQFGLVEHVTPGFVDTRLSITVHTAATVEVIEEIVSLSLKHSPLMAVFCFPQPMTHRVNVVAQLRTEAL